MQPERIYGLIGRPLRQSFSQSFFNQKFEAEGIRAEYVNFELPDIGDLMEVISEHPLLAGLNVTLPYKEQVIPYLDLMDADAAAIGAVNVIKILPPADAEGVRSAAGYTVGDGDFRLKGFNSDAPAFADTLRPLLDAAHRRALVLGTGGASRAVCHALRSLGVEPTLVSRNPLRVSQPYEAPRPERIIAYSDLTPEIMTLNTIVVNTTPLGMYPDVDACPDFPYHLLTPRHICYDLIYNPDVTLFMRRAAEHGAVTKNGLEMLLLQAFISYDIWNRP